MNFVLDIDIFLSFMIQQGYITQGSAYFGEEGFSGDERRCG